MAAPLLAAFGSMQQQAQKPKLFDLLGQYASMRDSQIQPIGPPSAIRQIQAAVAPPPAPTTSAASKLSFWGPVAQGPMKLGSWDGYQYDASVIPRFQAMTAAVPGLKATSGYRDPAHNAAVGGVQDSDHLTGRAGDFVGSPQAMASAAAWAKANGAKQVLIHNAGSGIHLHVAF